MSGRRQSGKSTSCNFVLGYVMSQLGVIRGTFDINEQGQLHVSDLFGDESHEGVFDYFRPGKAMDDFKAQYLDKHIKIYSVADILKKDICINILGLSYESVYGTDDDKNKLTHIKWENMPGVISKSLDENVEHEEVVGRLGKYYDKVDGVVYHEPGFMTGREVMQYVGTDIFRRILPDCWAIGTVKKIVADDPEIAMVCDCRFIDEIEAIQEAGGIVARLTLNSDSEDTHYSETALDNYDGYDLTIDNMYMTIPEQNQAIYNLLITVGLVDESTIKDTQ